MVVDAFQISAKQHWGRKENVKNGEVEKEREVF